ncbi:14124_t:CDS:2 [Acaulospora colombiana]|uniref:14124_t:CDS:1 n=1 Tax=Acaulospora colombiana TaxID=27376 RepID=A0ACA9PCS9_9GLOM|nr:14124_t:CDS:2 [Acaulospora colombiana]
MTSELPNEQRAEEMDRLILRYLSLEPQTLKPSTDPVDFLRKYISILPPSLLSYFSPLLTPLQRTKITNIRNRRLQYHSSAPKEFYFPNARNTWTNVWDEVAPKSVLKENWREKGQDGKKEEQEWAEKGFLNGKEVVGERSRLGRLLVDGNLDIERIKSLFERLLKERFIDGRLEHFDYDSVDWDDKWDVQSREDEERWFDEDDDE